MAITDGSKLDITLNMFFNSLVVQNVWSYDVTGTFDGFTAEQVGESWWNHVKTTYRATVRSASGFFEFRSVLVRQVDDLTGAIGEFAVPTGEQLGTRTSPTQNEFLPPFNAAGVRLTVGTRVTRPGQKRIVGLLEEDAGNGALNTGMRTIVSNLMAVMTTQITLGLPAVGMDLVPSVFRKDATGLVIAHQPIVGYVINPNVSSQVSRKY